jgi:dienelactone hydrolase
MPALAAILFLALDLAAPLPGAGDALQLDSSGGVKVYAQSYAAASPTAPVILLFHQAGSSKSEYAPIAPRLVQLGFNALAIDQRSGGDLFDPPNETVAHAGKSAPYLDALPDLEAALAWAHRAHPKSAVYVWGSSYSASLVFLLAAKHPGDIGAILAFSPGEYFDDKQLVRRAAREIHVPVFIDSADDKQEIAAARSIYDAIPGKHKEQYTPVRGVHGSSTLRVDRDPDGAAANWIEVTRFLRGLSAKP